MARRDVVRTLRERAVGKGPELDRLVAHNVRVGRVAMRVGRDEVIDHGPLILELAVPDVKAYAQAHGDALGIRQVICPATLKSRQVATPVAHVDGMHVVTPLNEERRRKRRVNPTAHAQKDPVPHGSPAWCPFEGTCARSRADTSAMCSSERHRRSISSRTTASIASVA